MAVRMIREGGEQGGVRKMLHKGAKSKAPAHAMMKGKGKMKAPMASGREMLMKAMGGM